MQILTPHCSHPSAPQSYIKWEEWHLSHVVSSASPSKCILPLELAASLFVWSSWGHLCWQQCHHCQMKRRRCCYINSALALLADSWVFVCPKGSCAGQVTYTECLIRAVWWSARNGYSLDAWRWDGGWLKQMLFMNPSCFTGDVLEWLVRFPQALSSFTKSLDTERQSTPSKGWQSGNTGNLYLPAPASQIRERPVITDLNWVTESLPRAHHQSLQSAPTTGRLIAEILLGFSSLYYLLHLQMLTTGLPSAPALGLLQQREPGCALHSRWKLWEEPPSFTNRQEGLLPCRRDHSLLFYRGLFCQEVTSATYSCPSTAAFWNLLISMGYWRQTKKAA